MSGKIKIEIQTNGALSVDMSEFKNCADKTKELMKELDYEVDNMHLKEEEVQTVSTSGNRVNVKR